MPASKNGLFSPVYCRGCGGYTELSYTTKQPQYCSRACKQKAYRKRVKPNVSQPSVDIVVRWYRHGLGCFSDQLFAHYEKYGENSTDHCVSMMISFLYTTGIARGHVPMHDEKLSEIALSEIAKRYG